MVQEAYDKNGHLGGIMGSNIYNRFQLETFSTIFHWLKTETEQFYKHSVYLFQGH